MSNSEDNQDLDTPKDAAYPWQEALGHLMSQMLDGELDAAQRLELFAILESSDEAKQYYLSYLQIHADLAHQWGVGDLKTRAWPDEIDSDAAVRLSSPVQESSRSNSRKLLGAIGWLAFGLAASGLFVTFVAPAFRDRVVAQHSPIAVDLTLPSDASTGVSTDDDSLSLPGSLLEKQRDGQHGDDELDQRSDGWNDVAVIVGNDGVDIDALQVGRRLKPGTVRFDSGTIQLQFMSGASMVLNGPAELNIESAKAATLLSGSVNVRVNERAKGFVLNTPEAAVVDIGTEFGLRYDESGRPEVEVIEGEVEFSLLGGDGNTLTSKRVKESEVVAVDSGLSGVSQLADKENRKAEGSRISLKQLPTPISSERYSQSIRQSQPIVYWRFETETDGVIPNEMGDRWAAKIIQQTDAESTLRLDQGALRLERSMSPRCVVSTEPIHGLDSGEFTVEMWLNPDDLEHSHCTGLTPFLVEDPMAFLGVVEIVTDTFLIHQPGSLRVLYRNPPDRRQEFGINVFSPGMLTPGQWHHVSMVNASNSLELYINGELVRALESEIDPQYRNPEGYRVILGQLSMVFAMRQYAGVMDEFALYDRALSSQEILQHYQSVNTIR